MNFLIQIAIFICIFSLIILVARPFGKIGYYYISGGLILFIIILAIVLNGNHYSERSFWLIVLFSLIPLSMAVTKIIKLKLNS